MNSTSSDPLMTYNIEDYYIVCSLSTGFAFIAIVICAIILVLVWRTKPRLHTVNHLLICNTCIASIFYCVVIVNNYAFLIFAQWETNDMSCRWRAYIAYVGIAGVVYSYLIQAISRFFFSVLSLKYRWLTTFKTHYILICTKWLVVLLITSPTVITKDIYFYPKTLCWVSLEYRLHIAYTIFAYYGIAIAAIIVIYIHVYYQVNQETNNVVTTINRANCQKRNLEILRRIIVLLSIYLGSGLPTILFCLTSIKLIYLINLVSLTLTVAVEKVCTILLDREIRQVIKSIICRTTPVMPFNSALPGYIGTARAQQGLTNANQRNAQHFQTNVQSKV